MSKVDVSKWKTAIKDAEKEIEQARRRISQLEKAKATFQEMIVKGVKWPATQN